jgi:hypothetical protein
MAFPGKRRTTAGDVRKVALAALNTALDDGKRAAQSKPRLVGVRAVAGGAVLYTVGRAVVTRGRFIRNPFGEQGAEGDVRDEEVMEEEFEEPAAEEDEEFEEPVGEEDEEFEEEEEYEEPAAEEDEYEEPVGEEDEEYEDDEYEDEVSSRPRKRSAASLRR